MLDPLLMRDVNTPPSVAIRVLIVESLWPSLSMLNIISEVVATDSQWWGVSNQNTEG